MDEPDDAGPITDAAGLGLTVLAQVVENVADGVFLCDDERRWVYLNDSAERLLGYAPHALIGRDYVEVVPPREQAAARQYYAALLDGSTEMVTRILTDARGEEHEMVFAPVRIDIDGRRHGAAFFHDFTETRAATRAATVLAHSAAESLDRRSPDAILSDAARYAVEGTRAQWAGLAVVGANGRFSPLGAYGPGGADFGSSGQSSRSVQDAPAEQFLAAMTMDTIRVGRAPSRAVTLTRSAWESDPVLSGYGRHLLDLEWESAVSVPLAYDNRVIGALMVLLPPSLIALSDPEIAFCTAVADHAAVALANERLVREAARTAELGERGRVARELHDSVSQAIFAMTMHARAAKLAMADADLVDSGSLERSLDQLSLLSRGTLAEMRSLIFDLRPGAMSDAGLVIALRTQAAAMSVRDQVTIDVDGPDHRLPLDPSVESALYMIITTIVQDAVQSGSAHTVAIGLRCEDRELMITIRDDGAAIDRSGVARPGLIAAMEDAPAIGATVQIASGEDPVVSVTVSLPTPRPSSGSTP